MTDKLNQMIPPIRNWLTSWFCASSSLLKPVGRGAFVVISMMYKSELRLLHNLPILSHREPSTSKLKRRVSSPRLTLKKTKGLSYQMFPHLRRKFPNCALISLRKEIPPLKLNLIKTTLRKLGYFTFFRTKPTTVLTLQNQHIRPANEISKHFLQTFIPRMLLCPIMLF